jgi:hypothetical protein
VPARPEHVPGRRLPLVSGQPLSPWTTTRPRMCISRGISKGSLSFTPASLPLACGPRRNGTLGLSPGLHTRPDRIRPRMPGWGRAMDTARITSLASASLLRRTHSLRATTRRNMPDTRPVSFSPSPGHRVAQVTFTSRLASQDALAYWCVRPSDTFLTHIPDSGLTSTITRKSAGW